MAGGLGFGRGRKRSVACGSCLRPCEAARLLASRSCNVFSRGHGVISEPVAERPRTGCRFFLHEGRKPLRRSRTSPPLRCRTKRRLCEPAGFTGRERKRPNRRRRPEARERCEDRREGPACRSERQAARTGTGARRGGARREPHSHMTIQRADGRQQHKMKRGTAREAAPAG